MNAKRFWSGRCPRFASSASLRLRSRGGSISHSACVSPSPTTRLRFSMPCVRRLFPQTPQGQLVVSSMSSATIHPARNSFGRHVLTASLSVLVRGRPQTSLPTSERPLTAISAQPQSLGFSGMRLNRNQPSPNHALQRTAPAVTLAASCLRLSPTVQPARQPPRSLSLRSLGVARASCER